LPAKLLGDLNNCVSPTKTGIPIERIHEVVFTFPYDIPAAELSSLEDSAQSRGVRVRTIGLQTLSLNLLTKYPGLAKDFLSVSPDTGQVLPADAFVHRSKRSRLTTPLD